MYFYPQCRLFDINGYLCIKKQSKMTDKLFRVGFNLMREQVNAYNLEDNFMICDNLSEEEQYHEFIKTTDFPINLNDISFIIFCLEGYMSIKFNVELKSISLKKNQLCLILPGQIFQVTEISTDFKAGLLVMKKDFFNIQIDINKTTNLNYNLADRYFFHLSNKEVLECKNIYETIKDKIKDRDNVYCKEIIQCYCNILVYNIYNLIKHAQKDDDNSKKNRNHYLYEKFMKLLEQYHKTEHTVIFYANRLCLTPKYLSSVIHNITGKHATEWIQEYRVLVAKIALRSTDMSLKNIAELLNFSTPSHFGRFFKHVTGMSPKEYRKLSS